MKLRNILIDKNKEAFDFIFLTNSFNKSSDECYQLIVMKKDINSDNSKISTVGTIASKDEYDSLLELNIPSGYEVFITKNSIDKVTNANTVSFGTDNCKNLHNIVIDIDCHNIIYNEEDLKFIKNKFVNDYKKIFKDIPEPAIINWSGRGLHIWYSIESSEFINSDNLYRAVANELCKKFKNYLSMFNTIASDISVDCSNSKCPSSLIRLFGSYNNNSGTYSEVLNINKKRYSLNILAKKLNLNIDDNNKILNKFQNIKQWTEEELKACAYTNIGDTYILTGDLPKDRMGMIFKYLQKNPNLMPGNRHNVIHLAYNYAIQCMNHEEAVNLIYNINSSFGVPLKTTDIRNIIRTTDRKTKPYKYKLDNFLEKLNITFTIKKSKCYSGKNLIYREELKKKNKEKKDKRNKYIIETYLKCGSFAQTAKKCKVCINTAKSVLKSNMKYFERLQRQFRREADRLAFSNYCKYKDLNKAAKKGRCNIKYVKELIDKYSTLRSNIWVIIQDIMDEIPNQIWVNKKKYHQFLKRDYFYIEKLLSNYTGLEPEDINIALAPYIKRV